MVAPGLEHALFWPEGDFAPSRGLRAKQDTGPGQVLVELPRGQAICLDEGEGTPFPQWCVFFVLVRMDGWMGGWVAVSLSRTPTHQPSLAHLYHTPTRNSPPTNRVPQKQWKKLPWYAQLGLKLVYERKTATSPLKASYAQLLPPPGGLPTPFHWGDADLAALRGAYPALAQRVDRQRQAWGELYDALGKTRAVREDMDEATFVWAMESVLSRAFKGTFGTGLRSLGPSLLLMGVFTAIYYADQGSIQLVSYALEEYPFLVALPAALTLLPLFLYVWGRVCVRACVRGGAHPHTAVCRVYVLLTPSRIAHPYSHPPQPHLPREFIRSKGTYVLAPMIDSLNHKSTVPTDLDYDSLRQRFRLRLGQGYKAGEQVCAWVWVGLVDVAACLVWCGVTLPVRCTRLAHSNPIQPQNRRCSCRTAPRATTTLSCTTASWSRTAPRTCSSSGTCSPGSSSAEAGS